MTAASRKSMKSEEGYGSVSFEEGEAINGRRVATENIEDVF